jgi:hypothetical protein
VVRVSQADVQARAAADSGDPGDAQPAGTNGKLDPADRANLIQRQIES